MKNLFKFGSFLLAAAVALVSVSCQSNDPDPVTPPTGKISPFTLTVTGTSAIETTKAVVNYSTSETAHPYFVGVATETAYNAVDATNDAALLAFVKQLAPSANLTTVDNKYVYTGNASVDVNTVYPLTSGTKYVAFAVAFNAEGAALTTVAKQAFTAADGGSVVDFTATFEVTEVTESTVTFNLTPSDNETEYAYNAIETSVYESYTEAEFMQLFLDAMIQQGTLAQVIAVGPLTGQGYVELDPEVSYTLFAFATDGAVATSAISVKEFTTSAIVPDPELPADIAGTITGSVTAEISNIYLTTDAASYSGKWYLGNGTQALYEEILAAGGNFADAAAQWFYTTETGTYGTDLSVVDNAYVFDAAVTDHVLGGWTVAADDRNNFVVMFPLTDAGQIDTAYEPTVLFVRTLAATAASADFTLDITVTDIVADKATVTGTPSEPTALYYMGAWTSEGIAGISDEELVQVLPSQASFAPNIGAGTRVQNYTTLPSNTALTVLAVGVDKAGNPTTGIFKKEFTAATYAPSNNYGMISKFTAKGSMVKNVINMHAPVAVANVSRIAKF